MQSAAFTDKLNSLITGNLIHNRVNLKWKIKNGLYFRLESRNRFLYGEQVKYNPELSHSIDQDNGYFDFSYNLLNETTFILNTTFDRALLNWTKSNWEITLGRQRLNWGINTVWNPNDIFNTYNYFDFDYEERPGSDALCIQYNTGAFTSFQLAYKFDKKINRQVGAVLYKTNFYKYDVQYFAGIFREDLVVGTGWAGNLKQMGFKGEVSYFQSYKTLGSAGQLSASLSVDRTFKGSYFVVLSYLYNSEGKDVFYDISEISKTNLSAKNLMPFRHTLLVQSVKNINPLISMGISTIFSPTKKSLILFPVVSISLSENWDLSFIMQSFFSQSIQTYKSLGHSVYLRLRWNY